MHSYLFHDLGQGLDDHSDDYCYSEFMKLMKYSFVIILSSVTVLFASGIDRIAIAIFKKMF